MKLLTKVASATAIAACSFGVMAAETSSSWTDVQWNFANVSVSHLDWSDRTTDKSGKKDFSYLEVEGGLGFSWGEFYGFYDLENPFNDREGEDGKEQRVATKGTFHYYLGDSNYTLYSQVYHTNSKGFYETNSVVGLGYRYANDSGLWIKPWIGGHYVDSDKGYNGKNGLMAGWVLGYSFKLGGQDLMISNWHEYEFKRADAYKAANGENGTNGAIALWWNATRNITAGVQYRYANEKLGYDGYQNAMIYTLKYNL